MVFMETSLGRRWNVLEGWCGWVSGTRGWGAKKWKASECKSLSSPLDSASCCCDLPQADCHPSRALKDQVLWSPVQSMAERIHILVQHGQVSTMASQLCLGDGSCMV